MLFIRTLMTAAVALLLSGTTAAVEYQSSFFSQGNQIPLTIDSSKVLVKLDSTLTQMQIDSVLDAHTAVQSVIWEEEPPRGYVVCSLTTTLGDGDWLDSLRADNSVRLVEPYYRLSSGHAAYFSDRICVSFDEAIPRHVIDSLNAERGVEIERELYGMPNVFLLLNTPATGKGVVELARDYYMVPGVLYSYPACGVRAQLFGYKSYDFYSFKQSHLKKVIGSFNSASVWDFAGLGDSTWVAVLDDGVTSHEDLPANRIVGGYDFGNNDYDPSPFDKQAHGQGCAGIIAASHTTDSIAGLSTSSGMFSMNPNARIMPVRIVNNDELMLLPEECAEAVTFAYLSGVDLLSCSWGWCDNMSGYDALPNAISRAFHDGRSGKGCPVIFAAGNCGNDFMAWPGYDYRAFAVGAVNLTDQLWDYSSSGPGLDVVAPSGDVCLQGDLFTLDPMDTLGYNDKVISFCGANISWDCGRLPYNDRDYDCHFGGTSAAAPIVAGVASLLLSRDSMLTSQEVYDIMRNSAVPLGGTVPNNTYGYGRVDAFRAVLSIARGDVDNNVVVDIGDLNALIDYLFFEPFTPPFPTPKLGDCDCDGLVDASDLAYLIDFVILGTGPAPVKPCFEF